MSAVFQLRHRRGRLGPVGRSGRRGRRGTRLPLRSLLSALGCAASLLGATATAGTIDFRTPRWDYPVSASPWSVTEEGPKR